jgi:hypothetical protein
MSAWLENSDIRFAVGDLDGALKWSDNAGEIVFKFSSDNHHTYNKIRLRKLENIYFVEVARYCFYFIKAEFKKLSEAKRYYNKLYCLYFK